MLTPRDLLKHEAWKSDDRFVGKWVCHCGFPVDWVYGVVTTPSMGPGDRMAHIDAERIAFLGAVSATIAKHAVRHG